jgi:hypothetical protein
VQVPCQDIRNSVADSTGACGCTQTPFTVQALVGSELRQCLSNAETSCPQQYSVEVEAEGRLLQCITDTMPCSTSFMPVFDEVTVFAPVPGMPGWRPGSRPGARASTPAVSVRPTLIKAAQRRRCLPKMPSCPASGYTIPVTGSVELYSGGSRQPGRSCSGAAFTTDCGALGTGLWTGISYLGEVLGCVDGGATVCPAGFVGLRSARSNFALELCTQTSQCHAAGQDFAVEPAKYGRYTRAAYRLIAFREPQLLACLETLPGKECPDGFSVAQQGESTICREEGIPV